MYKTLLPLLFLIIAIHLSECGYGYGGGGGFGGGGLGGGGFQNSQQSGF